MGLRGSKKGRRLAPLLLVVCVLCAACGARVSPTLRREAAAAALNAGGGAGSGSGSGTSYASVGAGTSGGSAGSSAGGAGGGGASAASGGAAAASGGAGGTSGSGGATTASGPAVGSSAPTGGNGGATDVGVSATAIQIANVSDLSGPVPGLFQGAVVGTRAYFNYVNSQGGVYGRQLDLQPVDSQTDCNQTENAYNSEINKVFAFVGGFALYDNCAAQVLSQHTSVPSVQYMLSAPALALPNNYSVDPIQPGEYTNGYFKYYDTKLGTDVQHVGTVYPNIPSAVAQEEGFQNSAQSVGWKFVYARAADATETNFQTDVIRMQSEGVKIVFLAATNAENAAILISEIRQQNWNPVIIAPVAYASNFIQLVGGQQAAEGILGAQLFALFFNASDASAIPEVALFQHWMQSTAPSQALDLEGMYGWAEAALFVQALKAAGPRATRASLLAALHGVKEFSDNGMIGQADPGDRQPTNCYVLWQIHNGQFQRVDSPASSYRCDGTMAS
ncbi:MAG: ABC transporter substrate-binding protein [Acidimicrobiales bacterium]